MHWNLLKDKRHRALFEIFKRLIAFRHNTDSLRNGATRFFYENTDDRVLGYRRDEDIIVVCHFSNRKRPNYIIDNMTSEPNTSWIDILTNQCFTVNDHNKLVLTLNSYDGRVLFRTNKRNCHFPIPLSFLCFRD